MIIPALNEAASIAKVIEEIPKGLVTAVIVCNNGSTDATREKAERAGAIVVDEPKPGYGWACLKGMDYIARQRSPPDIVCFIDGDYSDYPQEMTAVVAPVLKGEQDLVIGSRALGKRAKGAMTVPQRFGNWLATRLMRFLYGVTYTDLGPFRAIRYPALLALQMADKTYGWTIEMQIKAIKKGLRVAEVPVNYRKQIGRSKVSGTVRGTLGAGYKILLTIFKHAFSRRP